MPRPVFGISPGLNILSAPNSKLKRMRRNRRGRRKRRIGTSVLGGLFQRPLKRRRRRRRRRKQPVVFAV